MPNCPAIHGLKLDAKSRTGIERIRKIQKLSNTLAGSVALSSMGSIFAGSGPIESAYNITQHDWKLWADAMGAIPGIARNRIRQEAQLQYLDHLSDLRQQQFWKAIDQGCRIDEVLQ